MDLNGEVQRLLDKRAIEEQLFKWSRGTARMDWALARSVFTADARDDHGTLDGSIDEFMEWQKQHQSGTTQSVHFIGMVLVEFASDVLALAESHVIAFHHYDAAHARADIVGGDAAEGMTEMTSLIVGRYLDKFERGENGWKISYRQAVFETCRTEEAGRNLLPHWVAAKRGDDDPLHRVRGAMGFGPLSEARY